MNPTDEASEAGVKGLVQIRVEHGTAQAPKAITDGLSSQQIEDVMTACDAQEVRCSTVPALVSVSVLKPAAVANPAAGTLKIDAHRGACFWPASCRHWLFCTCAADTVPLAVSSYAWLVSCFNTCCCNYSTSLAIFSSSHRLLVHMSATVKHVWITTRPVVKMLVCQAALVLLHA